MDLTGGTGTVQDHCQVALVLGLVAQLKDLSGSTVTGVGSTAGMTEQSKPTA